MTNYNDGKWHGWNGGECPVHHESRVRIATETLIPFETTAKNLNWSHINAPNLNKICAFRVIKEHKEPRECWLVNIGDGVWRHCMDTTHGAKLFREVLE